MAKKPMKKQPPPPRPSSSSDEESPSPLIPPVKKISAAVAVLGKHSEPLKPADDEKGEGNEESSGSEEINEDKKSSEDSRNASPKRNNRATRRVSRNTDDANDLKLGKSSAATKTLAKNSSMADRLNEKDEPFENKGKVSTDEESSDDSRNAARQPNPLTQKRDPQTAKDDKQEVSNASSSSDSGSGDGEEEKKEFNSRAESEQSLPPSLPQPARNAANPIAEPSLKPLNSSKPGRVEEEENEDFESEEESMADESSEDFCNTAPKENPSTQPQDSQNKQASNTSSSSGSGFGNDEEDIEAPIYDPSLESLNNKPIDSSAQPVDRELNSGKKSAASTARILKKKRKKRTAGIVVAVGGQEKELFRRIWSKEDELALLQGILEYKERNHVIPFAQVHAESLLKSVKDSLSISVSAHQINDKVRRMKKRYNNTAARKNLAKRSKFSDPHNAFVFDLSKKIWDSVNEVSIFPENVITLEKGEENFKKNNNESKHFATEYPSLYWFLKSEHANNALVLQNHIPIANTKKLDEKCKKLEVIDIQLNMQKIEFLSTAVKLIKDSLAKC